MEGLTFYLKSKQWRHTIYIILCSAATIFITLSLYSYYQYDSSWFFYATYGQPIQNIGGSFGAHVSAGLFYLFGGAAYCILFLLCFVLYGLLKKWSWKNEWERLCAGLCSIIIAATYARAYMCDMKQSPYPGGALGDMAFTTLVSWFNPIGAVVALFFLSMMCLVMVLRFSFMPLIHYAVQSVIFVGVKMNEYRVVYHTGWLLITVLRFLIARPFFLCVFFIRSLIDGSALEHTGLMEPEDHTDHAQELSEFYQTLQAQSDNTQPNDDWFTTEQSEVKKENKEKILEPLVSQVNVSQSSSETENKTIQRQYMLPNIDIFIGVDDEHYDEALTQELKERAHVLEDKLKRFGIHGKVVAIKRGPVVTLFEYQPHIDTKLSKILSLEDDLAMALQALGIRIIAPIPGRSVVGFEVANKRRRDVVLAHVIKSAAYKQFSGGLPLILGQDTIGNTVIVDLVRMPHLLIAGSTGSGKSVALNAMLMSLLCKLNPDELKLILIDPKRLEFAAYADIAHFLFPIVTDPRRAAPILRWVVNEMERRYELMAKYGARNVANYNERMQFEEQDEYLPSIVVVIDELADLMLTVGRDIEELITRITQMARAAGIHMIVATQRPSVDVITGLIKANFPSRISFRVTSRVDSRTIIDTIGADKLLGRGDMLFLDATTSQLKRVHGAYVSDNEIEHIVSHIKSERVVSYLDVTQELMKKDTNKLSNEEDELYHLILDFLDEVDEVSISLLQRKFRIGYNRSARIIGILESQGLIMPPEGGKTRKVIR